MRQERQRPASLQDTTFNGDFMMAVPFIIFHSRKWPGRGKALIYSGAIATRRAKQLPELRAPRRSIARYK